jgi:hypothetical protein
MHGIHVPWCERPTITTQNPPFLLQILIFIHPALTLKVKPLFSSRNPYLLHLILNHFSVTPLSQAQAHS